MIIWYWPCGHFSCEHWSRIDNDGVSPPDACTMRKSTTKLLRTSGSTLTASSASYPRPRRWNEQIEPGLASGQLPELSNGVTQERPVCADTEAFYLTVLEQREQVRCCGCCFKRRLFQAFALSIKPVMPVLPVRIAGTGLQSSVAHRAEVLHLIPWLGRLLIGCPCSCPSQESPCHPMSIASVPASLFHQTLHRLFFGPFLLHGHVGQIRGPVSPASVREADTQPVQSQSPV